MIATYFAITCGVLLCFVGLSPGWFDSAEFSTAAAHLGVSHPSGHPLYVLAAHLVTALPFGSIAFRTSLLSALAAAGCATILFAIATALLQREGSTLPRFAHIILGSTAGWLVLAHPSVGLQSARTEVYSWQFFLSIGVLALCFSYLHSKDRRRWYLALFLTGLLAGNQPLLTAAFLPIVLCAPLFRRELTRDLRPSALLMMAIGSSVLLYSPLRAAADPVLNWDDPSTYQRFIDALFARDFEYAFHLPFTQRSSADFLEGGVLKVIPLPWLLIAILGVTTSFLYRSRRTAIFVSLWIAATLLPWLLKDFSLQNPDSHGYILVPIALFLLAGLFGLTFWIDRITSRPLLKSGLLLAAAIGIYWPIGTPPFIQALTALRGEDTEELARALDTAPVNAVIEVKSDHWLFPLWYRHDVEGRRPDIEIRGSGLMRARWYREQLRSRDQYPRRRPALSEVQGPGLGHRFGFLFSDQPPTSIPPNPSEFFEMCGKALMQDVFSIRSSVCNRVIGGAVFSETETIVAVNSSIHFLESYVMGVPSPTTCHRLRPVELPFPLGRDHLSRFLPEPERPITTLAIFYLNCGFPDRAETLLQQTSGLDAMLLRAFLLGTRGDRSRALGELRPSPEFSRPEKGLAHLAKATLYTAFGDTASARTELRISEKYLGASDPAVRRLREHLL